MESGLQTNWAGGSGGGRSEAEELPHRPDLA